MSILASVQEKFKTAALGAAVLIGSLTIPAEEARASTVVELGDIWRIDTRVVTGNDFVGSPTLGVIEPGTQLGVSFTINTAGLAPDADTSSAFNIFRSPDPITNVSIASLTASSNTITGDVNSGLRGNVIIENRQGFDRLNFSISNGLMINGFGGVPAPTNVLLRFTDPAAMAFASADGLDAFQAIVNNPSLFNDNFELFVQNGNGDDFARFATDQNFIASTLIQAAPAAVPEPGIFIPSALVSLALTTRRRRRRDDLSPSLA